MGASSDLNLKVYAHKRTYLLVKKVNKENNRKVLLF